MHTNPAIQKALALYVALLKLYPESYRVVFAEDMAATFADLLEETYDEQGVVGMWSMFASTSADIVFQSLKERLTPKSEAMRTFVPSNPIRGFRTVFWLVAVVLIALNVYPYWYLLTTANLYYVQPAIFIAFAVSLIPLMVRSKRGWRFSVFAIAACSVFAYILFTLGDYYLLQLAYKIADKLKLYDKPSVYSDWYFAIQSTIRMVGILAGCYLAIREVEAPRLTGLWNFLDTAVDSPSAKKLKHIKIRYVVVMFGLLTIVSVLFWIQYFDFIISGQQYLGSAMDTAASMSRRNTGSIFRQVLIVTNLLSLCLTAICSWGLTHKHGWRTAIITGAFAISSFVLMRVAAELCLPKHGYRYVSDAVMLEYDKGSVVRFAPEFGTSVEELWTLSGLPGTPDPNASTAVFDEYYYTVKDNFFFTGGLVDDGTRTALGGVELPLFAKVSMNPKSMAVGYWIVAYCLPYLLTIGLMLGLTRRKK